MNLDKMRRQLARNTPDAVWRTFDVSQVESPENFPEFQAWRDQWVRMMDIKHADSLKTIQISMTNLFDRPGHVRIQLVIA